ncbi:hypothetical protein [Sedimenticola sp.]|uniref:hypothetical protein n=1 Tax=Sedimenticola sp. TaxID=1940285 RepID=UPI003D0C4A29
MKPKQHQHNRRSLRLPGYDYSHPGAYFITLCTQHRRCLFGKIIDGTMKLNRAGEMIQTTWNDIPQHYIGAEIDQFVIMPNHLHGILMLAGEGPRAYPDSTRSSEQRKKPHQKIYHYPILYSGLKPSPQRDMATA